MTQVTPLVRNNGVYKGEYGAYKGEYGVYKGEYGVYIQVKN